MENELTSAKSQNPIRTLEEVLSYQNENVVHKFLESYEMSYEEAADVFYELKKMLWLCAISVRKRLDNERVQLFALDKSITVLDEMWHTFILFTVDYHLFCNKYFGFYIHHRPTTHTEKQEHKAQLKGENRQEAFLEFEDKKRTQYYYIYEQLGEETLMKWYGHYHTKYNLDRLNAIRKPM